MESSSERACPSCSAPAQADQRWCLDCGAELPQGARRTGLRPAVGIATTLVLLVGAASAGAFTLMQDGKKPPPPPTTVAQVPPPATTPPAQTTPPYDGGTPPADDDALLPDLGRGGGGGGSGAPPSTGGLGGGGGFGGGGGGGSAPPIDDIPDFSDDIDTSTPNPPPPPDDAGDAGGGGGGGSVVDDPSAGRSRRRAPRPRLRETDIALGTVAVVYPAATGDEDPGDPAAVVDGDPDTMWRTPTFDDPATVPLRGVYVDLGSPERLTRLVVSSPTPGMYVEVYAARTGPPVAVTGAGWSHVADATLRGRTTISLPSRQRFRYVLLWVTRLPEGGDHAAISELKAFSRQPA